LRSVAGYQCTEGEQKVVALEVNANDIRSVRSGRVGGVLRSHDARNRQNVFQI
ncbi:thioesterase, partial [Enterobacter intestinihominis]